ncbi:sigma 54-interacting transcriptional regulator [endosymbiont of unidentified scaly snail isolate Monju]|uniref:sigma 54-interacting transcriptional regulator n=1 Tax=endosymbiont of unidentified scaly snail isolate Monju TaxID=1248727 RepID=UPI0003892C8C|nr:sigma 54-interacting transcriptional regulator [endosymbiont of unidentified scaly snail isolate Monju]BAN70001.1 two-component system, NtrC family, response regulator HydG [endosymbiont of unidentified scaly snail isolate Monju]
MSPAPSPPAAPDVLLFIATGCAHCPAVLAALSELVKQGAVGRLEVVNIAARPEAAQIAGVRSVPWMRIGPFTLQGSHTPAELRQWVERAARGKGVAEYLGELIENQRLDEALARRRAAREKHPAPQLPTRDLIGRSTAMLEVSKQIALSAGSDANVLIEGESGTGKEVVARLIHQHSERNGPFVALNCAAIVDTLIESELFGHEKGAFTGADRRKPGKFELAAGGTLFLDEIGELALPLQAKLLRTLQERVIERVGGTESIPVDVRIIAATHRDLFKLAADGLFREDLAYRLKVIEIHLPPLRERPEDIPLLAQSLLDRIAVQHRACPPPLSETVIHKLQGHDWPGNVRELENTLTQALVRARGGAILPEHIRLGTTGTTTPATNDTAVLRSLAEVEAEHIQRVLEYTGGHKGRACEILGISRPALDRKITRHALIVPSSRRS